jgi:hypothetical protein
VVQECKTPGCTLIYSIVCESSCKILSVGITQNAKEVVRKYSWLCEEGKQWRLSGEVNCCNCVVINLETESKHGPAMETLDVLHTVLESHCIE